MDRLFGTDASYRNTINEVRHRNLFNFKSARERYPDNDIKVRKNEVRNCDKNKIN